MTRKSPAFSDRLEYLIWLRHLTDGECPSNAKIGEAVGGKTGPAVTAWRKRVEAPSDYNVVKGLLSFFGIAEFEEWFVRNGSHEAAPRPELWAIWWGTHGAANSGRFYGRTPRTNGKSEGKDKRA